MFRLPPISTLFPYTTLFRSRSTARAGSSAPRGSARAARFRRRPCVVLPTLGSAGRRRLPSPSCRSRSEEHTSELQSRFELVCRLLLEKKKRESSVSGGHGAF